MIVNAEDITSMISIDDIIGEFVELKHRGVNKVGCCPFHKESTPSFSVSRRKGIYKCFGCGEAGDVVEFLKKYKKMSYPEAIQYLSSRVGIAIRYEEGTNAEEAAARYKENRAKTDILQSEMNKAWDIMRTHPLKPNIPYAGKTYTAETIAKWKIIHYEGKHLMNLSKLSKETLMELGVINQSESGRYFDSYINRAVFPLVSTSNEIIAFTARRLDDKKELKYINSPTNLIFNKSAVLFGLNQNKESIKDKEFLYLVEGTTDVIMLDQYGIGNAVATMGTDLTLHHCKKMSMYTDRVSVLRDGDPAGLKAAIKDVEIITKSQLQSSVVILPNKEDPASFIIKKGTEEFKKYVDKNTEDGIIWRIKIELGTKKDPFQRNAATEIAARLLALIKSDTLRESYVKDVSTLIGVTQKIMSDAVKDQITLKLDKKEKLSEEQELCKAKYGIYQANNRIFSWNNQVLSNFAIKPIFLVRNGSRSNRIFEMTNEDNFSICLSIDSDDMTSLNTFRKGTEMHGNYVFEGQDKDFIKLRKLIYSDMQKVYQLPHLGYISQSNIYAWGNGITTPKGEFIPVDEFGHVIYDKFHYYLPAFSKMLTQEIVQNQDDTDYEKNFIYRKSEFDFKTWYYEYSNIFADNAMISIGFYVATIFRDYVQKKYNFFPILNLFGPAGSGKSTMAAVLTTMFGQPVQSVHCITATWSAFFRTPAQIANAIRVYEEYSEKVEKERQEGLKSFYDGFGRPLAKKETSNKTESIPVLSTIVLVGQVLPTHDPALLTRCITVFFKEYQSSQHAELKINRFKKLGKRGDFAHVTADIHTHREEIIEKFEELFEPTKDLILERFEKTKAPNARVLMNYSIVSTFLCAALEVFNIKYALVDVLNDIINRIKDQNQVNEGATELLEFWTVLSFLIDTKKLDPSFFIIEMANKVRITDDQGTSKDVEFAQAKKLLYIKVNHVHKEYLMSARSQGLQRTLDANTIKYYLKTNRSYIGEIKAKRPSNMPNATAGRYWVFDADQIPSVDLELTNHKTEEELFPEF